MSHVEDTGMASHMEESGSLSDQEQLLNDNANWFEATPDLRDPLEFPLLETPVKQPAKKTKRESDHINREKENTEI